MNNPPPALSQSRAVFIGNIPYQVTEPQLVQLFSTIGPIINFRMMFDKETGRPKGYAFCEYGTVEAARSAKRNLNGYGIDGRELRVDFADTDKGLPHPGAIPAAGTGQPPPYNGMQMPPPMHPAAPMHPGQPPVQYAPPPQSSQTPNEQQSALLLQLKSLVQHDPEQARRLLLEKPHLSYMVLDLLWRFALIESKAVEQVIAAGVAGNPGGMGIGMPSPVNMPAPLGLPAAPMQQQPQPHIPSQVPQGGQQQPVYSEEYKAAILKKAAALTPQQFEQLAPDLQRTIQMLRHQQL